MTVFLRGIDVLACSKSFSKSPNSSPILGSGCVFSVSCVSIAVSSELSGTSKFSKAANSSSAIKSLFSSVGSSSSPSKDSS